MNTIPTKTQENTRMNAVVHTEYGSPDVLHLMEVAKPTPKNNEVLIKVHATTVNRTDCGFRTATPFIVRFFSGLFKPKNTILGSEFAGEIEAVGSAVSLFKKGDKVFGLSTYIFGTHADYICLPETASMALKPANMPYAEAAAICDGAFLALNMLRGFGSQRGQKILINGATGSIGTAAVQLSKHFDLEITAVGNTKNLELVKSLGANEVIDYLRNDFTKTEKTFDFVFDAVGKSSFFRCRKLLKPNGIYISTELGYLSQNIWLALLTPLMGGKKVLFPIPKDTKEDITFFKELIETGQYKAVIDRIYPLAQLVEATRYVETGEKTGNVVIIVDHD
jgi:NADPH:quinone reductase-like Zn-dependent oxidoreductase